MRLAVTQTPMKDYQLTLVWGTRKEYNNNNNNNNNNEQLVYVQPKIRLEEWDTQTSLGFWYTNGSPNLALTTSDSKKESVPAEKWTLPCR